MNMSLKIEFHVLRIPHYVNSFQYWSNHIDYYGITRYPGTGKSWAVSQFCTNNIAILLFIQYIAQTYVYVHMYVLYTRMYMFVTKCINFMYFILSAHAYIRMYVHYNYIYIIVVEQDNARKSSSKRKAH